MSPIDTINTYDDPVSSVLDSMMRVESSGNPQAVGRAGERGLFQIKPQTALQYGIKDPSLLFDPQINRTVARAYLGDLMTRYNGDLSKALAAYNAGPGNVDKGVIPPSTRSYVNRILGSLQGGQAQAAEPPGEWKPPPGFSEYKGGTSAAPSGGAAPAEWKPPPGFSEYKPAGAPGAAPAPSARPTPGAAPSPSAAAAPSTPWPVRAAGFLPMAGQYGGEVGGGLLGEALVPGPGGYVGAVAGGAGGAALGAVGENRIRAAYGLPPVSVGEEALLGGATSGVGQALKVATGLGRAAKAGRVATQAETEAGGAFAENLAHEGALESTIGSGERVGKMIEQAPASMVRQPYLATRAAELDELGKYYDAVLKPFRYDKITQRAMRNALNGAPGKLLDISGKPIRTALENEMNAAPMTVTRARVILSQIRQYKRGLDPQTAGMALGALNRIEDAVKADIRSVITQSAAQQLDALDYHYARKIAQYPVRAIKGAYNAPQAAEKLLSAPKADVERVVDTLNDMRKAGQIKPVQKAVASRIWQMGNATASANPLERMQALQKAVASIDEEAFDALYGPGARNQWLNAGKGIMERNAEWLKHPDQAAAVRGALREYLEEPGVAVRMGGSVLKHRLLVGGMLAIGGYEFGSHEAIAAGGSLAAIHLYEWAMHTPGGMALLEKIATSRSAQEVARNIVALASASLHAGMSGSSPEEVHR